MAAGFYILDDITPLGAHGEEPLRCRSDALRAAPQLTASPGRTGAFVNFSLKSASERTSTTSRSWTRRASWSANSRQRASRHQPRHWDLRYESPRVVALAHDCARRIRTSGKSRASAAPSRAPSPIGVASRPKSGRSSRPGKYKVRMKVDGQTYTQTSPCCPTRIRPARRPIYNSPFKPCYGSPVTSAMSPTS